MRCPVRFLTLALAALSLRADEIHDVALAGKLARAQELLGRTPALLEAKGGADKRPLHYAAQGGHLALAAFLLDKGAQVNARNNRGETPLVYAAEGGHLEVARLLLAKGADVNARTAAGDLPVGYAFTNRRTEVVRLLLEKGTDVRTPAPDGSTLLFDAARLGDPGILQLILDRGVSATARNAAGETPMAYASSPEVARLLMARGGDPREPARDGSTLLHRAGMYTSAEFVQQLLDKGIPVNAKDERGQTPLFAAAAAGNLDLIRLLLDKGAEIKAVSRSGANALVWGLRSGRPEVLGLLLERGVALDAVEKYGGTVLDLADRREDPACARFLESKGARRSPRNLRPVSLRGRIGRITFDWGMRNNLAVSAGNDGILLVDSGFTRATTAELGAALKQGDLRYVVNSHNHGDHTAGNALAAGAAKLIDSAVLAGPGRPEAFRRVEQPLKGPGGKSLPGYWATTFNGEEVRFIHVPGMHSPRDLLTWFTGSRVVFMGDLLLSQNAPSVGNPGTYLDFLDAVLDVFPADTIFLSGHGRDLDKAGLAKYRDDLRAMAELVKRGHLAGKSAEAMVREDLLKTYKAEYSFLDWLGPDSWIRVVARELQTGAWK